MAECLLDVFSDSHEVIDDDDRWVDLGSFRGSAALPADVVNRWRGERRYDGLDFYLVPVAESA